MNNDDLQIIDVQCTVIHSERVKQPSRYWGVCASFIGAVCAGGAGFGLWSGSAAVAGLVGVALVLLLVGLNLKVRPISAAWALWVLVGIGGIALSLQATNGTWAFSGLLVAGVAVLKVCGTKITKG